MREERAVGEEVIDKGRETATESRGFRLEAEIFLPRRRTFWRMPSMEYGNIFGEVEYRREGLKGECAAVLFCSHRFLWTVRQLVARTPCPYNVCGGRCAAVLFVRAVCFLRAIRESPVTLFALPFGFALTDAPSQTSVGEGLAPPVLCSHNHLAEKKSTISLYLGRGRRLRRPEKTLIYNGQ